MATTQVANKPPRSRNSPRAHKSQKTQQAQEPATDLLIPFTGLLAVPDKNNAFVRTAGYHPGPDDVRVSPAQVKAYGLRPGDLIEGTAQPPRSGQRGRQGDQHNTLVHVETVGGVAPEEARARPEFGKLTPLFPQERLRLDGGAIATRIIDLVAPIGKGQRGLIVSPPKVGKTMILQAIANAVAAANPECHLMVVLIDERPEEVTDMRRSISGEIIHSTFDRPPKEHIALAELAVERAKRLVEQGRDVVIMLDSLTRLARAYNLAAPNGDRILAGGVATTALYPPKRFLGAARNIEHGGSLTILATALVENESRGDEVFFEEFKGTGNMELKLNRQLADRRIFPAVDIEASGTRREELMVPAEELDLHWRLRRALHSLDRGQAVERLLEQMNGTTSNAELLLKVQQTA